MKTPPWAQLIAYVAGMVNQELLLRNEYLAAENRILRARLPDKLRLVDSERATLAEIGKRLGRKALEQVACIAKPDTILGWYRLLYSRGSDCRGMPLITFSFWFTSKPAESRWPV
jgi:putative transposase